MTRALACAALLAAACAESAPSGQPGDVGAALDASAAPEEPLESQSTASAQPVAPASAASARRVSSSLAAQASSAPAGELPAPAPRYLPDNPRCPVPAGQPTWTWRRVHKIEGLEQRAVVLTLDVGAKLPNLEKVLDLLRAEQIATTIFLYTGELARSPRGPEIVRRMVADGHELANHTVSHKDLTKLELAAAGEELDGVERFVKSVDPTYSTKPYFREPFLATNDELDALVKERCYRPIWFTIDTADWKDDATAEKIEAAVFERRGKPRQIDPGSIFIFHGSQAANLVALPRVIRRLKEQGFGFLTLGQALALAPPKPSPRRTP